MLLLRRVKGKSMEPYIHEGHLLIALRRKTLKRGQLIVFQHEGRQKLKRIARLRDNDRRLFVVGSNRTHSTDSRDHGWIESQVVIGVVIWPRLKT